MAKEKERRPGQKLRCPRCAIPAHALWLGPAEIDLCRTCAGMWFDRGELALVQKASEDEEIHRGIVEALKELRTFGRSGRQRTYLPCPVCTEPMKRVNFAKISGILLDRCPIHGTWASHDDAVRIFELLEDGGARLQAMVDEHRSTELARRLERLERQQAVNTTRLDLLDHRGRLHIVLDALGFL
ncbi:MAG: zf-TFIIB domain-containing protein [Myxococcota bacterium]